MRTVIDGNGNNSTAGLLSLLSGASQLLLANLYLIGEPGDPTAIYLTDWATPLLWSAWGRFQPTVIKRGSVTSKVGLEVQTMEVTWSPNNFTFTQDISSTSPYQQAYLGKFDNVTFRSWTCYMLKAGDANSIGASELFGGRIGDVQVDKVAIKFTVNSFLDVVNQQIPGSVIEVLNSVSGFKGATPPRGLTQVPTFAVFTSVLKTINGDCATPNVGQLFAQNAFQGGFLQFTSGPLKGMYSAIDTNYVITDPVTGLQHNQFVVVDPFPWVPQPGDTFYASATYPINQLDGSYFGFPYVPDPSTAI